MDMKCIHKSLCLLHAATQKGLHFGTTLEGVRTFFRQIPDTCPPFGLSVYICLVYVECIYQKAKTSRLLDAEPRNARSHGIQC